MSLTTDSLYALLPAVYRLRDLENGEPLRALVAVLAGQGAVLEADIARLYENWFIETCDEWVVPYLGDLLGVRGLRALESDAVFSQRARVANTLGYRRRKGTATMLEQLARDTTGWAARAVEFYARLGWTQNVNHLRPNSVRTPDLRATNALELLDGAFDATARSVDVRAIALNRGCYNLPNIGLFLWRLGSFYLEQAEARPAVAPGDGRFFVHPLGVDSPLFNRPQTETDAAHLAEEVNVPGPLRRRPLYDELNARRQALVDGDAPDGDAVYFAAQPTLEIFVQANPAGPFKQVRPEEIAVCHLGTLASGDWPRPPATLAYVPKKGGPAQTRPIAVGVDPVLGRVAFPAGVVPGAVRVSSAYGFSGAVGAGNYDRNAGISAALAGRVDWQAGVSREPGVADGVSIFDTLGGALAAWSARPPGGVGLLLILDSGCYEEDAAIEIPAGSRLIITAAGWPLTGPPGSLARAPGLFDASGRRPCWRGHVVVTGTAPVGSLAPGELTLDGVLLDGSLRVADAAGANLGALAISHCTLATGAGGVRVDGGNPALTISVQRSIIGGISLPGSVPKLSLRDSIVDAGGATADAVAAPGAELTMDRCTVIGRTTARELSANGSLFTGITTATRRQTGCVRFCALADGSQTPRRYRCQPDLALADATDPAAVRARLVPMFTSTRLGDPGYGQLAQACAAELRTGAEDGSEIGAFSFLKAAQREAYLRDSLNEYLRFGLEAGLIFVT